MLLLRWMASGWRLSRILRYILLFMSVLLLIILLRVILGKPSVKLKFDSAAEKSFYSPASTPSRVPPVAPPSPHIWVLLMSPDDATHCIRLVASSPQSIVLMVGVNRAPQHSHSRCHSITAQEVKRFTHIHNTTDLSPSLLAAYSYMMQRGAEWIYIPPPEISVKNLVIPGFIHSNLTHTGLVLSEPGLFNANGHFGCNTSKPVMDYFTTYELHQHKTPVIQTAAPLGPLNHVDTRAISGALQEDSIELCDHSSPPVTLSSDVFSAFSPVNTVYHKDAFWALPWRTDTNEELKLKWSLVIQKLLWLTGNRLMLFYSIPAHNASRQNTAKSIEIIGLLNKLQCTRRTFIECAQYIAQHISHENVHLESYSHWINFLKTLQYEFPTLTQASNTPSTQVKYYPVNYAQPLVTQRWRQQPFVPVSNAALIHKVLEQTCDLSKLKTVDISRPWHQYSNLLLVIVFNKPHYEVIPYLEALYRPFFPRILYCGPKDFPNAAQMPSLGGFRISFVTYQLYPEKPPPGAYNYECVILAQQMNYNVDGYLFMADDVLVPIQPIQAMSQKFPHNVWYLPKEEIRIGEIVRMRECRLGMCDFYPRGWPWWHAYRENVIEFFYDLRRKQWDSVTIHKCYSELQRLNGADLRPNGGYSDIFHIPQRLMGRFSELAQLALKHEVFLEIAVPTILRCLETPEETRSLVGLQLWMWDRDKPWIYFNHKNMANKHYLHPTKWSNLTQPGHHNLSDLYCNKLLPFMHDRFARFPK